MLELIYCIFWWYILNKKLLQLTHNQNFSLLLVGVYTKTGMRKMCMIFLLRLLSCAFKITSTSWVIFEKKVSETENFAIFFYISA